MGPPSDSKDSLAEAQQLGEGTRFFSTHKLTARVACPGKLAVLKPVS